MKASLRSVTIWIILGVGLLVRLQVAPSYGHNGVEGDLYEYRMSMNRALTLGFHQIYTPNSENDPAMTGERWTGGYFVTNPPVRMYSYFVPALIYRHFAPETFAEWHSYSNFFVLLRTDLHQRLERSRGFKLALVSPAIIADLMIALMLYLFLTPRLGAASGLVVAAVYSLNPGIIIDTAHLGSHDSVWIALIALSILLVRRGFVEVAWVVYSLAAFTKPQALAFGPLIAYLGVTGYSLRRVVQGGLCALGTCLMVGLPFLLGGTFVATLSALFAATFGGEPLVSLNAMNFWWLATWGHGLEIRDTTSLLGLLTYRTAGLIAFVATNVFVFTRVRPSLSAETSTLFLAASVIALGFFTLNTELHENHMMSAIPLVAFALPADGKLRAILGVLSFTLLLNLTLFDSALLALIHRTGIEAVPVIPVSIVGATVNTIVFAWLARLLWKSTKVPREG